MAIFSEEEECKCGRPGCDVCEALPAGDEDVFQEGYDPDEDEPFLLTEVVSDDEADAEFNTARRQDDIATLFDEAQRWAHEEEHDEVTDRY